MKIIKSDSYKRVGSDYDDELVCENINSVYGKIFVSHLNQLKGMSSLEIFSLKNDDYVLRKTKS